MVDDLESYHDRCVKSVRLLSEWIRSIGISCNVRVDRRKKSKLINKINFDFESNDLQFEDLVFSLLKKSSGKSFRIKLDPESLEGRVRFVVEPIDLVG